MWSTSRVRFGRESYASPKLIHQLRSQIWRISLVWPAPFEDDLIASFEPSEIRTAVTRLLERLPETAIEIDGEKATHPAVAILRGRLEEYNRQTRKNNKERWDCLRRIIEEREKIQAIDTYKRQIRAWRDALSPDEILKLEKIELAVESKLLNLSGLPSVQFAIFEAGTVAVLQCPESTSLPT